MSFRSRWFARIILAAGVAVAAQFAVAAPVAAAEVKPCPPMNNAGLERLIRRLDPKAQGRPGFWQFTVEDRAVLVITDERADRMRIITEVTPAANVDPKRFHRLLQANFDSTLDARYSIAKDVLWSIYLHPLKTLRDADFLSGVGQVVNLAATYGTSYSSGALVFGGGDSGQLQRRELIERLLKKGQEI